MRGDTLAAAAKNIASRLTGVEREAAIAWLDQLIGIRRRRTGRMEKAKAVLQCTLDARTVWPAVKVIGTELMQYGWDDRTWGFRFMAGKYQCGGTCVRPTRSGHCCLVGVPLWIGLGAGGKFAAALAAELSKKQS